MTTRLSRIARNEDKSQVVGKDVIPNRPGDIISVVEAAGKALK